MSFYSTKGAFPLHTSTYDLYSLGWTPELSTAMVAFREDGLVPGRVGSQHRGGFVLYTIAGDVPAEAAGRLHRAPDGDAFPVTGDWVVARVDAGRAVIEAVLPRRTAFVRATADMTRPDAPATKQVVAANVDVALVVTAAGADLNLRRLERYLTAAWDSGARPVVVVTKVDLVDDPAVPLAEVDRVAVGVSVVAVSNVTGAGVDDVRALIAPGRTAALLGSSGVGKSSLVNRLLGSERQAVAEIRADGRGRHTTTNRELIQLAGGGLVLDTPGMRVLKPWDDGGLDDAFSDVDELAGSCRFGDCRHESEPGCAVRAAIAQGSLEPARLEGYEKLRRELAYLERKGDKRAEAEERRRWRAVQLDFRRLEKERR